MKTIERDEKLFCPHCDAEAISMAEMLYPENGSWFDIHDTGRFQSRLMECQNGESSCGRLWQDYRIRPLGIKPTLGMLAHGPSPDEIAELTDGRTD